MLSFTETLIDISNQCIPKSSTISFKKKKPWFNDECKEAIKKRKDSLKRFKPYPTKTNLNACKILRAKNDHLGKISFLKLMLEPP